MAELKVKIETDFGLIKDLLEDINAMQTYKLFENDDMILVNKADLCEILVRHVRTRRAGERPAMLGHWITESEAEELGDPLLRDNCSVCGRCDWDCTESRYFRFCPNCGTPMEVNYG